MEVRSCVGCGYDLSGTPDVGGLRECAECGRKNPRYFTRFDNTPRFVYSCIAALVGGGPLAAWWVFASLVSFYYLDLLVVLAFIPIGAIGGLWSTPFVLKAARGRRSDQVRRNGIFVLVLAALLAVGWSGVGYVLFLAAKEFIIKQRSYC